MWCLNQWRRKQFKSGGAQTKIFDVPLHFSVLPLQVGGQNKKTRVGTANSFRQFWVMRWRYKDERWRLHQYYMPVSMYRYYVQRYCQSRQSAVEI